MTLNKIRAVLRFKEAPTENCGEVNALLGDHVGRVADRIRELRALEKNLKANGTYFSVFADGKVRK